MGKIGDLIVRLQLKYEDYKKGLKEAERETKGLGANLNKGIGLVKAAWAAVGVAVVAAAKTMITEMSKASNKVGDMMAVMSKQVGAIWQTMITSITAGFDNFLARAESSAKAARALQEMEDAEFEMLNSVKLKRAELEQQLIKWEIESKDATKSYTDRKKAAEKYLEAVKGIYGIEMSYYKDLAKQSISTWLQSSSTPRGKILGYSEQNAKYLYRFLKEYGSNKDMQSAIADYRKSWESNGELWAQYAPGKRALSWVNANRQDWDETQYRRFALDLGWAYEEQKNDELNGTKLVDNIEKYLKAVSAYDVETKKMQNNLNSLSAQVLNTSASTSNAIDREAQELAKMGEKLAVLPEISDMKIAPPPDIIPDDWLTRNRDKIDAAVAEAMRLQGITEEINRQFNEAVVNSLSGATQALADCIMGIEGADASQVLAALLQPFAQTMISLGEMLLSEGLAIEVFNESLRTLKGGPAIAAGLGLIALGSALSAGIQALAGSSGSATSASTGASAASSSASGGVDTYQQEITVHVVGEISGDKIVLAGQKTLNKWNR